MSSLHLVPDVRPENMVERTLPVPVLIVDDNASKRFALRAILAPLGYSIVEADSGSAALRCVMEQDFAVILLDVLMPVMDGFETAAHIRTRRQSEMTPIIFITAHGSDEITGSDLYAEGAVDFIFAPVPPTELRAKVSVFANLFIRAEALAERAREVQASADQLVLLTDAAPIGIFQTDASNRYVYTNPRWTEITGIPAALALGNDWESIAGASEELAGSPVAAAEGWSQFEVRISSDSPRVGLVTSRPIEDAAGAVTGWVGTLADVTDASREREAEAARRRAEERYRRIVETTMDGIWLVDVDGLTTFVNEPMAAMLQTTPDEMQGRSIFGYYDGPDRAKIEVAIRKRQSDVDLPQIEVRLLRPDGTSLHAVLNANSIRDDEEAHVGALVMVRDVTEAIEQLEQRERLEEQLRHSQRLESIGQLAGGIAHDFNNLLFGIRGFGERALGRLERGEDPAAASAEIKDLLEASDRAAQLTRQLLAFGRRQVLQLKVVDLREVVWNMENLVRQLIGDRIEVVVTTSTVPVLVEVDQAQLEQVITNLVINAGSAMAGGTGRISLDVALSTDGRDDAVLTVTDDGCGMDAETTARVFEPFFSTKGAAGSGFGLATVHGIVSQSGGRIALDSTAGVGTTFTISLPGSTGAVDAPASLPSSAEGGAETILVVEDDPMVRTIVTAMLEDSGYRVMAADSGARALEMARETTCEVDLILTDLVMPGGLGGRETAANLRVLFPGAKLIYMSGYSDDALIRGGTAFEPSVGFIQKPFGSEELARHVREILEVPGA